MRKHEFVCDDVAGKRARRNFWMTCGRSIKEPPIRYLLFYSVQQIVA
jgi:hypothetical protein